LLEHLVEPVGRAARQRTAETILKAGHRLAARQHVIALVAPAAVSPDCRYNEDMEAATTSHAIPQPADDPKFRDAQRERLQQLRDELVAEGANGSNYLPELQRRADTWPE
jgi:hypothetical protein